MIIMMVTQMSGGRYDDRPWPPPGVPFEVPDEEGEGLVFWHHAVKIADSPAPALAQQHVSGPAPVSLPAETAAGPVPEQLRIPGAGMRSPDLPEYVQEETPEPPKPADPKSEWISYAVSQGADEVAAGNMTKADLMSRYGGRM